MKASTICLAVLLLAGCVSASVVPPKQVTGNLKRVRVIAMESPPLDGLPQQYASQSGLGGTVASAQLIGSGATAAGASSVQGARIGGTATVIGLAAQLSANSYCDDPHGNAPNTVQITEGAWTPTTVLADEIKSELAAAGITTSVETSLRLVPCIHDRRLSTTMENWLGPIRGWYNDERTIPFYVDSSEQRAYVLEIAVSNFELVGHKLLIQTMVRLIDPADGRIIGRARANNAWNMPRIESLEDTFGGDAAPFKALLAREGRTLIRECLTQLGLVPT